MTERVTSVPMFALWEDVQARVIDAVEFVLTDGDPDEPPLPSQIEWAQEMAKLVAQEVDRHLDGYEPDDIRREFP